MKRMMSLCFLIALILMVGVACGKESTNQSGRTINMTSSVDDVLAAGVAAQQNEENKERSASIDEIEETETKTVEQQQADRPKTAEGAEESKKEVKEKPQIDVDITELSATMAYSEVCNMIYMPDDYMGKTVKVRGIFDTYYDEVNDLYFHACIVMDPTGCCAQGVEFVATNDYSYPQDFPTEGEMITVAGEFDTYVDGPYVYSTLRNAIIY